MKRKSKVWGRKVGGVHALSGATSRSLQEPPGAFRSAALWKLAKPSDSEL